MKNGKVNRGQMSRDALAQKNREYLESVRKNDKNPELRSQILGAIFDSSADGILVFDEAKNIVLANETAARLSGWELEAVSRQELHERFKFYVEGEVELPIEEEPLEVAIREKRPAMREAQVKGELLPDEGLWVRAHAAPVLADDGTVLGGVTVIQNISEQVKLEQQRDCLVSLIAHDLKNHLAAESIFFKFLAKSPDLLDPGMADIVETLQVSNERFLMMTESLMELSRAKFFGAAANEQSVDLAPILQIALESNQAVAHGRQVTLNLTIAPDLPQVYGLPAVVGQIFHNVILNAIEVSEQGMSVDIEALKLPSGGACVLVVDRGPGISPEDVQHLFDPNRVASHVKRTTHSTGFGLYLSAMLAKSLGGKMSCESDAQSGTRIQIEFPTPENAAT